MSKTFWTGVVLAFALSLSASAQVSTAGTAAALSELYPITINLAAVTKAGVTPGTGYVLVRDLKQVMTAKQSGAAYVLETPGSSLRFSPGQRVAALNGSPAALSATPVRVPDSLLFPLSSLSLLGCSYQPLAAMSSLRPYRVTCGDQQVVLAALTFTNRNAPASAVQPSARVINQLRVKALQSD